PAGAALPSGYSFGALIGSGCVAEFRALHNADRLLSPVFPTHRRIQACREPAPQGAGGHAMSRDEWQALVERARGCDMLQVAQAHKARLRKYSTTHEFVGPCPLCGGTDRFSVNPKQRMFNCRGCRKGGHGPVDLEMFLAGVDFVEAVKTLTGTVSLSGLKPATKKVDPQAKAQRELERERD